MFSIGQKVETINGVGIIEDIRINSGCLVYLICTGRKGFGGDRDVYGEDEFVALPE